MAHRIAGNCIHGVVKERCSACLPASPVPGFQYGCSDCGSKWTSKNEPNECLVCGGVGTVSSVASLVPNGAEGVKGMDWIKCAQSLPRVGAVVDTKIDDANGVRNEQQLKRSGTLWFLPDGSMYVYYAPTHWRQSQ